MASKIIGRVECPECGFHAAHIKQKTLPSGEVDATKKPYRYCPDGCGSYFPPNAASVARMVAKMRPESGQVAAPASEPEKTGEKSPEAVKSGPQASAEAGAGAGVAKKAPDAPKAPKSKRGFFASLDV